MIRGICHTNLDSFRHATWPTEFVEVPRIGSSVEASSGASLKVVNITHAMIDVGDHGYYNTEMKPIIKIELNK